MKKTNKRGLNAAVKKVFANHYNDNPAVIDKALKEVAKRYGMTMKELNNWLADRV